MEGKRTSITNDAQFEALVKQMEFNAAELLNIFNIAFIHAWNRFALNTIVICISVRWRYIWNKFGITGGYCTGQHGESFMAVVDGWISDAIKRG